MCPCHRLRVLLDLATARGDRLKISVDLLDVGELLARERRNLRRGVVGRVDQPRDSLQNLPTGVSVLAALGRLLARGRGGGDDLVHLRPRASHRLPDPRSLRGGLRGKLSDLVGHDGEAASVLAGACRFDRRVEGQQLRLAGDPVNDSRELFDAGELVGGERLDQLMDADDAFADLADRVDQRPEHVEAPSALDRELLDQLGRLAGGFGRLCGRHAQRPRSRTQPLELVTQALHAVADDRHRDRAPRGPARELRRGLRELVERARNVATQLTQFAALLGQHEQRPGCASLPR